MNHMGYHWKRTPKGQHKDGHEHEDVVAYKKNVFLPFVDTLIPQMCKWTPDGTLENGTESFGPCDAGLNDGQGGHIVIWVHSKSTFYANNRCTL